MHDSDMMLVPGFGQMKRGQVEREIAALKEDIHSLDKSDSAYEYKRKTAQEKIDALRKAHPIRRVTIV